MAKLHACDADRVEFLCPGCNETQVVLVGPGGWQWNGSMDRPTFMPSILQTSGHFVQGHTGDCWCTWNREHPEEKEPFLCRRCHSFVRDGNIQFLSDCSHALAGQTVPLPEWRG